MKLTYFGQLIMTLKGFYGFFLVLLFMETAEDFGLMFRSSKELLFKAALVVILYFLNSLFLSLRVLDSLFSLSIYELKPLSAEQGAVILVFLLLQSKLTDLFESSKGDVLMQLLFILVSEIPFFLLFPSLWFL